MRAPRPYPVQPDLIGKLVTSSSGSGYWRVTALTPYFIRQDDFRYSSLYMDAMVGDEKGWVATLELVLTGKRSLPRKPSSHQAHHTCLKVVDPAKVAEQKAQEIAGWERLQKLLS